MANCDVDNAEITDAPDSTYGSGGEQLGYQALKPKVVGTDVIGPSKRSLCRAHYFEEFAEIYPDAPLPELEG